MKIGTKKILQLLKNGPLIFYHSDVDKESGPLFMLFNSGKEVIIGYIENCEITVDFTLDDREIFEEIELVDWFEFEENNTIQICSCDLFSVLMITGCRCGGK